MKCFIDDTIKVGFLIYFLTRNVNRKKMKFILAEIVVKLRFYHSESSHRQEEVTKEGCWTFSLEFETPKIQNADLAFF